MITQTGTPAKGGARSFSPPSNTATVVWPREVTGPDGKPCIIAVPVAMPKPVSQLDKDFAEELWGLYIKENPNGRMCPGQNRAPGLSPEVIAVSFWKDIPLPAPAPHIAPGWMITGKTAYLETNGTLAHTYRQDTPFGPLEIAATGRYMVDWGDGTGRTGPYALNGAPWPDGQITHVYIDVGHYNVVVTEEWSATWRLGDETGTLSGLSTVGRIDNFRVEQIQAVIVPN
ncbi:MAG: hypothetical protein ACR2HY_11325 [Acidimicrobiales bacterium]